MTIRIMLNYILSTDFIEKYQYAKDYTRRKFKYGIRNYRKNRKTR